ncbi:hypothetical protein KKB40_00430 [Patescibacteria group bacterium]|nr:hypothetical protein [Patescibacteria group bacterium]
MVIKLKTIINSFKANIIPLILLVPTILFIQELALKEHLLYGFRDVDWGFIRDYKLLPSFSLNQILTAWRQWGVYTYQMYYIGIQEQIFGINFLAFNRITQFFKFLSVLTIYPLMLMISKRKLTAFVTTIIYAAASPAVGAMFSVVTSGNYLAVVLMNFFLIFYLKVVSSKKPRWVLFFFSLLLFFITMFLSTERMYPLLFLILAVEFFRTRLHKTARLFDWRAIVRVMAFWLPAFVVYIFKPNVFIQFFRGTQLILGRIKEGNWQLLLTPFASLGSIFLPKEQWGSFGVVSIAGFFAFYDFMKVSLLPFILGSTVLISILLPKKKMRFVTQTLVVMTLLSAISYLLASHNQAIDPSLRVHFDMALMTPILFGVFLLALSFSFWCVWLDQRKNHLFLFLSLSPAIAFLFIVVTWIASDYVLVFTGVQRYLTIPAIGSSMFVTGITVMIFDRLRKTKFIKVFSPLVFVLLIPFIAVNIMASKKFFYDELYSGGMIGFKQTKMKDEFWSYVPSFSDTEPSLFYFDESTDYENGYFHESAIIAGFKAWPLFRGRDVVVTRPIPGIIRTNINCVERKHDCVGFISEYLIEEEGKRGIMWKNTFYKPENFYAFRLNNKHVINITSEVKEELDL